MIHAYSEFYLNDAKRSLGEMFDYAVHECKMNADHFAAIFIQSGYGEKFENGNPAVVSGISGVELAQRVIYYAYREDEFPEDLFSEEKSPEYWAGWALAEYQWYTGKRFKDIFSVISFSEIVKMYPLFHEMDITQFIDEMDKINFAAQGETRLKRIRENRGISQVDLSRRSGVNLRSIQMYEQRVNDIDKAQGKTLYRLSRILGCSVEDLLESPMVN